MTTTKLSEMIEAIKDDTSADLTNLIKQGKIDLNIEDDNGLGLLHYACLTQDPGALQKLIAAGCNINAKDHLDRTTLHYASIMSDYQIISILISNDADITLQDIEGNTALHYACLHYRPSNQEVKGDIVLHYAFLQYTPFKWNPGTACILQLVLASGRNYYRKATQAGNLLGDIPLQKNNYGETPLDISVKKGDLEAVKSFWLVRFDIMDNVIYDACQRGHLNLLRFFLEVLDFDINNQNKHHDSFRYDDSLLHIASERGDIAIIEFLIQRGIDKTLLNLHGSTALHVAFEYNNIDAALVLIERGAPLDIMDEEGNTPLDLAEPAIKIMIEERVKEVKKAQAGNTSIPLDLSEEGLIKIITENQEYYRAF